MNRQMCQKFLTIFNDLLINEDNMLLKNEEKFSVLLTVHGI